MYRVDMKQARNRLPVSGLSSLPPIHRGFSSTSCVIVDKCPRVLITGFEGRPGIQWQICHQRWQTRRLPNWTQYRGFHARFELLHSTANYLGCFGHLTANIPSPNSSTRVRKLYRTHHNAQPDRIFEAPSASPFQLFRTPRSAGFRQDGGQG